MELPKLKRMRNITLTWHRNAGNLIAGPQFGGDNGLVQGIALGRANLEAFSLSLGGTMVWYRGLP